jgi:hypothetical protein
VFAGVPQYALRKITSIDEQLRRKGKFSLMLAAHAKDGATRSPAEQKLDGEYGKVLAMTNAEIKLAGGVYEEGSSWHCFHKKFLTTSAHEQMMAAFVVHGAPLAGGGEVEANGGRGPQASERGGDEQRRRLANSEAQSQAAVYERAQARANLVDRMPPIQPAAAAEAQQRAAAQAQQRAAAEAKQRAAAEAKRRAAAEAKRRAATEAKQRAATEATRRAATEAKQRAATEARGKATNATPQPTPTERVAAWVAEIEADKATEAAQQRATTKAAASATTTQQGAKAAATTQQGAGEAAAPQGGQPDLDDLFLEQEVTESSIRESRILSSYQLAREEIDGDVDQKFPDLMSTEGGEDLTVDERINNRVNAYLDQAGEGECSNDELQKAKHATEAQQRAATEAQQRGVAVNAAEEEAARVQAAKEGAARVKAVEEEAARVKAVEEEAARVTAAEEQAARVKAARAKAARVKAARKATKEGAARVKATEEEAARVKAAEEEATRVKAAEGETARVKAARVGAAEEGAARVGAAEEEAARVEAAREEAAREATQEGAATAAEAQQREAAQAQMTAVAGARAKNASATFQRGDEVDVDFNGKYFLARIINKVRLGAGTSNDDSGLKFNVKYLDSNHAENHVDVTRLKRVCHAGVVAQQAVGPNPKLDNGGIKKKRKRPKHTHQTVEPSSSWVKVSSAGGVVVVNWFCDTCKQWNMGAQVETKGGCKNPKKQCGSCTKRKQVRVPKHIFDSE